MSKGDRTGSLNGVMAGYSVGNAKIESVCCIVIDGEPHNSAGLLLHCSYWQARVRTTTYFPSLAIFCLQRSLILASNT